MAQSVLITGANRGIGLELVKQLAHQTKYLFAGCRNPNNATILQTLAAQHSCIHVVKIDIHKESTIQEAFSTVSDVVGDIGLNLLVNNAGIYSTEDTCIEKVSCELMKDMFHVDVIGPALICKTFVPLLRKASSNVKGNNASWSRAAILNVNSGYGCITQNNSTGVYAYKMAKAALNMLTKNLSNELAPHRILVTSIEPGWVQTDMGGVHAPVSVQQSVEGMLSVVSRLTGKENGTFWTYKGKQLPW